ncbi:aminoglycoside phosphotransferase family protein [Macrococcus sp. EM39E]|uniref:aminoglycoside phosphotransferase family protein n=1 Tax=Macrococcus animalis TaxID=3395467 RepID=UPI0039BDF157
MLAHPKSIIQTLQDRHYFSGQCIVTEITSGTSSTVFFIDDYSKKFILKLNEEKIIQSEVAFLKRYAHLAAFPNVISTDDRTFILMEWLAGEMLSKDYSKMKLLQSIAFMKQYDHCGQEIGYLSDLKDDFKIFLKDELELQRLILSDYIDIDLLLETLHSTALPEEIPTYVHGDFGYHNMMLHDGTIRVIDPTPMQNLILYELLFLYFSSPMDINNDTFKAYYRHYQKYAVMSFDDFKVYAQAILALRISTSTRHHPEDTDSYINIMNKMY